MEPNYKGPVPRDTAALGAPPSGWCWVEFGAVMNVRGGYAFKSIDYLDAQNGVALIRQSELKTATVDICSAKHLPHEYLATF